ncbi:ABC transporter ATP-binding protein [Effusibacillus dendaii]|uniref:ABC transporter ATP-binding protein n=1 Tax=Effusibacillus dendaii TaxID=2743772 RepID=A0A7I8DBX3_9BACL|nr:ABC transporter ATP-binding protein [Effusibacillus dendaii]BCJ86020.1 ABC transporter ATP-binding protein [Effusibacillus dendaii]
MLLQVEHLDVFYGDVQAIWDMSFHVNQGEIVTLVGANGAGKTTLLKTLSGLLQPRGGTITFDGVVTSSKKPHDIVAEGIVHIPEGRQLWSNMSVIENLELGAYGKEARKHSKETLDWVMQLFPRLQERRHQKAGTMSGGEQQMCAIGRGLMSRPKLLMLDEPSLGLAPKLVGEVFEIIQQIAKQGVTILLVEQNIHHALQISDRGYVLETGRIILDGTGKELLANEHVKEAYLGIA